MHSNKSLSMNMNLTNSKKNINNFKYKFYKNKIIVFDGKNFNYLIDKKENENLYNFQIKKKRNKSKKNINFNLSPSSNANHLTFNNLDSKDKKENYSNSIINENNNLYDQNKSSIIEENIENYYTVLNFKNYGIGVNYFELDFTNLQISIFPKNVPKLFPNLNDIKYFFDEDTQKNDEEITNLDDNDDYLDKSKCEINKYKILKKELKNKTNCIFDLFLLSNSSLIVHIIMSIILLMKYLQYIKQAKNGILGIFYIIKLLNYTMTSSNFFIDSQFYKNFNSIGNEIKDEIFDNISIILQNNSVYMYDILSFKNLILTDLMNEINKTMKDNNNIELGYLNDFNSLNFSFEKKFNSYIESNNQFMAIIYMISLNIGEDDFNSINSFFLYYNSINDYFSKSVQLIMKINGIISNYYPIFYQILIIILGLFLDVFLFVLMNFLINTIQNKINEISLEFLNIKPLEYKFIYKVANDFYKKIKINYNNEEEDFEDENTEIINKKNIEKKRNNKYLLNQKFNKIRLIGKIKNVAILSFFLLIFGLYYLILYLYIKNYQNNIRNFMNASFSVHKFYLLMNFILLSLKTEYLKNASLSIDNDDNFFSKYKENLDNYFIYQNNMSKFLETRREKSKNFSNFYNNKILIYPLEKIEINSIDLNSSFECENISNNFSLNFAEEYFFENIEIFFNEFNKNYSNNIFFINYENNDLFCANLVHNTIIVPYYEKIFNFIFGDVNTKSKNHKKFLILIFVVCLIVIMIFFFTIIFPMNLNISQERNDCKYLIFLIPTKILINKKSLLEILRKEKMISIKK